METQYKIRIGTDERDDPSTLLSYEDKKAGVVSNRATDEQDFEVVGICRGLAELLDSQEIEVMIKSKS